MKATPKLALIFDRKKRATTEREGSVEIRVYADYAVNYVPTNVRVLPKHWFNGKVVDRFDAEELNTKIMGIYTKLSVNIRKYIDEQGKFDWVAVEDFRNMAAKVDYDTERYAADAERVVVPALQGQDGCGGH